MCEKCRHSSRRGFMTGSLAGLAAAGVFGWSAIAPAAAKTAPTSLTPDEALAKLKEGNAKFVRAPELCEADLASRRAKIAEGQAPWATILSCADSRVPPELVFGGVSLGELFVCRNAGNVADLATLGTIEYGSEHLGVPLIVVLGHTRCGAVAAACEAALNGAKFSGFLGQLVDSIMPVAKELCKEGQSTSDIIRASAERTAKRIATLSAPIDRLISEGKLKVVSAVYDLDTGVIEFMG
jgi:carbonic anhydrase